jgi:hypothetical protein
LHRNSWRLPGPITIDPDESDSAECLWTFLSDCLISEAVVEEFRSRGFTGLTTTEVRLSKRNQLGRTHTQFIPSGWGGIASKKSGIELTYRCDGCRYSKYSSLCFPEKLFDPRQWDGSDVFIIWPLPKFIFVTSRVADVLRELRVSGIELIPIERMKTTRSGFTPGRLSHYLPSSRAIEIGEPLGID